MNLYQILVPCNYNDTGKPVRTRHHKNWDAYVRKITGGLTILTPGKGQWIHKGDLYEDRVIPVNIMCEEKDIKRIAEFTAKHYRQIAVMYFKLSSECVIHTNPDYT